MYPFTGNSITILGCLCFLFKITHSAVVPPRFPTVSISSGTVIGTTRSPPSQPSTTAKANLYLGIPYAQSPPERFSPPTPAGSWKTPLQAQEYKPACVQQFLGGKSTQQINAGPDGSPLQESEDCLYLNIYSPSAASPTNRKAVLFWIYGGNLQFGAGSVAWYDGTSFAVNQDIVLVTFNYRTNSRASFFKLTCKLLFGFSNSPEVPFGQQNVGYLDQRLALTWVQENIAQFGGDPDKVTIVGESAGAYSVKQLLANPPSSLPFRAAILQSQQAGFLQTGPLGYDAVLSHFSCEAAPSPIDCLRKVPATSIKSFIEDEYLFFPPVDKDGTQYNDVRASILSRKFADVPIFLGTNANELSIFFAPYGLANGTQLVDTVLSRLAPNDPALQHSILALYAGQIEDDGFLLASHDRIGTDAAFTCTTASLSNFAALHGYRVWRYRYAASFPNQATYPNLGAYHTSEIPQVFGTYDLSNEYGNVTTQQIQLSAYMQRVWANFVKNPDAGTSWPRLGTNFGVELGDIGNHGSSGETTIPLISADFPCPVYDPIVQALGFGY
ncbi:liver carboxylesterase 1 precursor [Xylogone sp. PMI_703]|nr:liver carboxylesterase 1 precursor [Xylogone sp. PMI_703]